QRVTWTNRHDRVAAELVFNVHSHFKLPSKDIGFTAKMLEILRVTPSDAIDALGRACEIQRVTLLDTALSDSAGPAGQVLSPHWDNAQLPQDPKAASDPQVLEDTKTALIAPLPRPVARGETVTVELEFTMRLPQKQGRWGQWQGVTFLSNWLPVLAYYDDK